MNEFNSTTPSSVGIEEIERVTRQHLRDCPTLSEYCTACECGSSVVVRCGFCHTAMWLVPVRRVWCEHAEGLTGEWHRIECGTVPG